MISCKPINRYSVKTSGINSWKKDYLAILNTTFKLLSHFDNFLQVFNNFDTFRY